MDRWNSHAWYYAAVTLNQVVLTATDHDREVARVLIDVYFEMFREILGGIKDSSAPSVNASASAGDADADDVLDAPAGGAKADGGKAEKKSKKGKAKEVRGAAGFAEVEDAHSRLVSAVLTGVNRALPFARVDLAGGENGDGKDVFARHMDTLFLITHKSTFNISLQALMLILQVTSALPATTSTLKDGAGAFAAGLRDRFYRTLYGSLLDQRLATSNKQAMYLNLLFKALKADTNVDRVKAFVRRFIQILVVGISSTGGVEFVAGGLYLLGEVSATLVPLDIWLTEVYSFSALCLAFELCSAYLRLRSPRRRMTLKSATLNMRTRPRRHCTSWYVCAANSSAYHRTDIGSASFPYCTTTTPPSRSTPASCSPRGP